MPRWLRLLRLCGNGRQQVFFPGLKLRSAAALPIDPQEFVPQGSRLFDQLRSTLHRVRGPQPGEAAGSRYSVAFFAQANKPTVIESPTGRFEPLTAEEFLQRRINANFDG